MALFQAGGWRVIKANKADAPQLLAVYKQCEDFLALGPEPAASLKMVYDDLVHSHAVRGQYCRICDGDDRSVGILDYIPATESEETAFIELLMIGMAWRRKGIGRSIVEALEKHLQASCRTRTIHSAVQTNNDVGIRFWASLGYVRAAVPQRQLDGTVTYRLTKVLDRGPENGTLTGEPPCTASTSEPHSGRQTRGIRERGTRRTGGPGIGAMRPCLLHGRATGPGAAHYHDGDRHGQRQGHSAHGRRHRQLAEATRC